MAARSKPRAPRRLAITVTDALGRRVSAGGLGTWLAQAAPRGTCGTVAVALVSDRVMRRLNREFRGDDKVTDVLSFPDGGAGEAGRPARRFTRRTKRIQVNNLGDIAIATGRARRQAREHRHPLGVEIRILALHGLLHLLGYDHERDWGEMHTIESRLRRRQKLPQGLIARASIRPSVR